MSIWIQRWLNACEQVKQAQAQADAELRRAKRARPPKNIRKAEASDIVVGALIWYPQESYDNEFEPWAIVEEVLHPSDDWKAYTDHKGCRRGLRGAFVQNVKTKD